MNNRFSKMVCGKAQSESSLSMQKGNRKREYPSLFIDFFPRSENVNFRFADESQLVPTLTDFTFLTLPKETFLFFIILYVSMFHSASFNLANDSDCFSFSVSLFPLGLFKRKTFLASNGRERKNDWLWWKCSVRCQIHTNKFECVWTCLTKLDYLRIAHLNHIHQVNESGARYFITADGGDLFRNCYFLLFLSIEYVCRAIHFQYPSVVCHLWQLEYEVEGGWCTEKNRPAQNCPNFICSSRSSLTHFQIKQSASNKRQACACILQFDSHHFTALHICLHGRFAKYKRNKLYCL